MARLKDIDWRLEPTSVNGNNYSWDAIHTAVAMDIRDELKELNSHLRCRRIQRMFSTLERMDRRLAKKIPLKVK